MFVFSGTRHPTFSFGAISLHSTRGGGIVPKNKMEWHMHLYISSMWQQEREMLAIFLAREFANSGLKYSPTRW